MLAGHEYCGDDFLDIVGGAERVVSRMVSHWLARLGLVADFYWSGGCYEFRGQRLSADSSDQWVGAVIHATIFKRIRKYLAIAY